MGLSQTVANWTSIPIGLLGGAITWRLLPPFRAIRRARAIEVGALSFKEREELRVQRSHAWTQMLSSLGVLAGVAFTAASLTYTARALRSTQEGQITDRYTKAVEQLGNRDSRDARTGAIYSLERLADDSARDRVSIIKVLATYVDDHIRTDAQPRRAGAQPAPTTDVRAALSVLIELERKTPKSTSSEFPFHSLDLRGLDLTETVQLLVESDSLKGANLSDAYLHDASLARLDLGSMDLSGADLSGADLSGAQLYKVNLSNSRLSGANFKNANLVGADLRGADLSPEVIAKSKYSTLQTETNLAGADLGSADLRQITGISAADVRRQARIDEETIF
ncbi:pentapeptide repeat-containing protein [Actinomadura nitritigenes]|uniref:pentapeptide repeat-containing protein n=1 Tax=Actinomadura nitritigenes TaxID=134602 RepID=UPI003D941137